MNNLVKLSASEMRAGLLSGDFSAVELTKAHLEQIESTNEKLNSFITISEDRALKEAEAADAIIKEKTAEYQKALKLRRERFVEELEAYNKQVRPTF